MGKIRASLAENMGISTENINVKAKTEEKLGFTGEEKGMKSYAVCLLDKI